MMNNPRTHGGHMLLTAALLVIGAIFLASCTDPVTATVRAYFPNTSGAWWSYQVIHRSAPTADPSTTDTVRVTIVGDTTLPDERIYKEWLMTANSGARDTSFVRTTSDSVIIQSTHGWPLTQIIRTPFAVGRQWGSRSDSSAVAGVDALQLPAGTFPTVYRLDRACFSPNVYRNDSIYIAPYYGIVAMNHWEYGAFADQPGYDTWTLITFHMP